MQGISVEIIQLILEGFSDVSELIKLRLVSKTFKSVVTPRAFHAVSVTESLKSAKALSLLQTCDESITSVVRQVSFRGKRSRRVTEAIAQSTDQARRDALRAAFGGLSKFTNLQSVQLTFDGSYDIAADESGSSTHLLLVQFDILGAISSHLPSSLNSLTVTEMVPLPHELYTQTEFHNLLRSLKSLNLSVRYDFISQNDITRGENRVFEFELDTFWHRSMSHILSNATSLNSLTLYDGREGEELAWFAWMPETTRLTHLTSLHLHDFVFPTPVMTSMTHEIYNVLGFILLHKATLTHLVLNGCSILMDADELKSRCIPLLWHVVLRRLTDELTELEDFVFTSFTNEEEEATEATAAAAAVEAADKSSSPSLENEKKTYKRDPRFLYQYMTRGGEGIKYYDEALPGEERDVGALEDLLATVEARRASRTILTPKGN
ncbi:hypothetical protein FB45DRAFT_900960 [Roridomyces roridus]|uniref:F-box domain-containing protein n=1 Tax=Roridomyces roridus TaxID=1738132 RepID=A0AAD7C8G8_9AGAR|nr:hypothetical protein FB45DRAFT_900960 [Roridomyces roridus]